MDRYAWLGQPIGADRGRIFYAAIFLRWRQEPVRIGDDIEVAGSPDPQIGRVEALWEDLARGEGRLRCRWYFRPHDVPDRILRGFPFGAPHERELLLSELRDDADVRSIMRRAFIARSES
ncbi:unnamed protein product, partial [Phaeothamnion confervicola]